MLARFSWLAEFDVLFEEEDEKRVMLSLDVGFLAKATGPEITVRTIRQVEVRDLFILLFGLLESIM